MTLAKGIVLHANYGGADFQDEMTVFLHRLAKAVGFNDADLAENRKGRLSTPQLSRLTLGAVLPFAGLAVTAAGLVGIGAALTVGSEFVLSKVRLLLAFSKYLMMGVGALFFGLLAFGVKFCLESGRMLRLLLDTIGGRVGTVTGRVTPSRSEEVEDGLNKIVNRKTET